MQSLQEGAEPRWHAAILVAAALVLYVTLPPKVVPGPLWLLPTLILVILVPLLVIAPRRHKEEPWQRAASIVQIALLGGFNIANIVLLFVWQLSVHHHKNISGEDLLRAGAAIWLTNVIVYGLWFWEVDRGGPDRRNRIPFEKEPDRVDFMFPQMAIPADVAPRMPWKPRLLDYVFVSFTNATAFSPTDTYPLSRLAKTLMMVEAFKSLITIALIAGRAVNILGS